MEQGARWKHRCEWLISLLCLANSAWTNRTTLSGKHSIVQFGFVFVALTTGSVRYANAVLTRSLRVSENIAHLVTRQLC